MHRLPIALALYALLFNALAREALPQDYKEPHEEGLKYIEAWDVERAATVAKTLMGQDPANPRYRYLMAKVLFYLGEYAEANEVLTPAIPQLKEDAHAVYLAEMIGRTLNAIKPLSTSHEGELVISLDAGKDSILIPYIKDAMRTAMGGIEGRLGYRPDNPLRIEVYPDAESFYLASSLTRRDIEVSGAVGICKFNKIMLISPRALVRGYPWLDTLSHEYLHYVIVMLSANRAPVWLHEGIAKYYEAQWRSEGKFSLDPVPRTLLAQALENNSLITFEEMYPSLVKLATAAEVQLAYAEAATAIEFIAKAVGDSGIRKILKRMAEEPPREPTQIIESSLGMKGGEFALRWKDYLRSLHLKPVEGLEVLQHRIKEGPSPAFDLREIKSEVARNHMRLGDMLSKSGRITAAALEYRRALDRNPHSPIILNRLGSALVKTGSLEEGMDKLKRAEELYPDFGPTYKNLAEIYQKLNRLPLAEEYYLKAIRINPFDPSLHAERRAILLTMGRMDEAKEEEAILEKLISSLTERDGKGAAGGGDTDD